MNFSKRIAVPVIFALFAAGLVNVRAADDSGWQTVLTLRQPLQINSLVLDPGTYLFQRSRSIVSREFVMIYSVDRKKWDGFVSGIPVYRTDASYSAPFIIRSDPGERQQLMYWFNPGWNLGIQFRQQLSD